MEQIKTIIETHFINDKYVHLLLTFKVNNMNIYINKFKTLENVLSNIFLNDVNKGEILTVFCNIQRFIHAIYRLKNIWKWKRANVYNTEDLYMNPIQIGQKNTITLLQNNTKYIFQI